MNFLEYLGLESLLGDGGSGSALDAVGSGGGILGFVYIIGFVFWIIMALCVPDLLNKNAATFNLITSLLLLIMFFLILIKDIKDKRDNKALMIADAVCVVYVIGVFIYGLFKPYHSIQYEYEYIGIWSGLASTTWPLLVANFIRSFFYKDKLVEKLKRGAVPVLAAFAMFISFYFIGQSVACIISMTKNDGFYDHFIRYHKLEVTEFRKNWEYESAEEFIKINFPKAAKERLEKFKTGDNPNGRSYQSYIDVNDYEGAEKSLQSQLSNFRPNAKEFEKNYIYYLGARHKEEFGYVCYYVLCDKEYNEKFFIKFDYSTFTMEFITEGEYKK